MNLAFRISVKDSAGVGGGGRGGSSEGGGAKC